MSTSIKISELSQLNTITYDDFIPLVDSASLTTYRVRISDFNTWMSISGSSLSSSYALTSSNSILATNAISSSYSLSSSNSDTSSYSITSSNSILATNAISSSYSLSSSFAGATLTAGSSSYSLSSSYSEVSSNAGSSSYSVSSSHSDLSDTSSFVNTSSYAYTASYVPPSEASFYSGQLIQMTSKLTNTSYSTLGSVIYISGETAPTYNRGVLISDLGLTFTPKSSLSVILVEVTGDVGRNSSAHAYPMIAFYTSSVGEPAAGDPAVSCITQYVIGYTPGILTMTYQMGSWGTTSNNFRVRLISSDSSELRLNRGAGGSGITFDGRLFSTIRVLEYIP